MVPAASGWVPRAPPYSGSRCFPSALRLRGSHPLRPVPMPFRCASVLLLRSYYPSPWAGFGLLRFRSPLLPESLLFSFPPGTQMFHFPGFSSLSGCIPIAGCGFPHSDTAGSSLSYSSPARFAV